MEEYLPVKRRTSDRYRTSGPNILYKYGKYRCLVCQLALKARDDRKVGGSNPLLSAKKQREISVRFRCMAIASSYNGKIPSALCTCSSMVELYLGMIEITVRFCACAFKLFARFV